MIMREYECNTCHRRYETMEDSDAPKEKPCEFSPKGIKCEGLAERVLSGFSIGNKSPDSSRCTGKPHLIIVVNYGDNREDMN